MSDVVIAVENLSKRYFIKHTPGGQGRSRYTALRDVVGNELRRYRLFGRLPGRNKLKAGSRLLVSPFPEIKFICLVAGCCEPCGQPPTSGQGGGTHSVFPSLGIGDRAGAVRRGSAQPTVHKFTAPPRHGVRRPVPTPPSIGRGTPRPVFASRAPDAEAADCTS